MSLQETAQWIREFWKRIQTKPDDYFKSATLAEATADHNGEEWINCVKTKTKRRENIDHKTGFELMLCQIPGISVKLAQSIIEFTAKDLQIDTTDMSMRLLLERITRSDGEQFMKKIPLIGPKKVDTILEYLGIHKKVKEPRLE